MPLGNSITWGVNIDNVVNEGYRKFLYQLLTNSKYNFHFVGGLSGGSFPEPNNEGHPGWEAYRQYVGLHSTWF